MDSIDIYHYIDPAVTYLITAVLGIAVGWLTLKVKEYKKAKDDTNTTLNQIIFWICKGVIYSPNFTIDEKCDAYLLYASKGGNGKARKHMSNLVGEDIDDYITTHITLTKVTK